MIQLTTKTETPTSKGVTTNFLDSDGNTVATMLEYWGGNISLTIDGKTKRFKQNPLFSVIKELGLKSYSCDSLVFYYTHRNTAPYYGFTNVYDFGLNKAGDFKVLGVYVNYSPFDGQWRAYESSKSNKPIFAKQNMGGLLKSIRAFIKR